MSTTDSRDDFSRFEIKPGMHLADVESQGLELVKTIGHLELPLRYQNEGISECRVYSGEGKDFRVYYDGQTVSHVNVSKSDRKLRENADQIAGGVNLLIKLALIGIVGGSYVATYFYPFFAFKAASAAATLFLVYYFFIYRGELA